MTGANMAAWEKRVDTRTNDMAHGITFHMWERYMEDCRGEAAYNTKKLHLDGKVSLTIAQGQHKYGDELIAQVYGVGGEFKPRRAITHNRIQVYLGKIDESTATMLEEMAQTIRKIISETTNSQTDLTKETNSSCL